MVTLLGKKGHIPQPSSTHCWKYFPWGIKSLQGKFSILEKADQEIYFFCLGVIGSHLTRGSSKPNTSGKQRGSSTDAPTTPTFQLHAVQSPPQSPRSPWQRSSLLFRLALCYWLPARNASFSQFVLSKQYIDENTGIN